MNEFGFQIILTILVFVAVAVALRVGPVINARWVTAAASVAILTTVFSISYYLWRISVYLCHLCQMLAGQERVAPELDGTVSRLVGIVKEMG